MFTGIIETTGSVASLTPPSHSAGPTRITIHAPGIAARLRTGDSVAVSGCCLTALEISATHFSADLADETVRRTHLAALTPGAPVNLELPTPAGAPLGGHVVQGHVDGVGTLIALDPLNPAEPATSDWRLRLRVPTALLRHIIPQGSLTVEGISLTVAALEGDKVSIAIIPHTWAATTLRTLAPGAPLNLETDALARYAAQLSTPDAPPAWTVTEEYLLANGY